jgi:hypothetical protein
MAANSDSTFVGNSAGLLCTAAQTTAGGSGALAALTTGVRNTAWGYQAGGGRVTNVDGTFVGCQAGNGCTADNQTFIGSKVGGNVSGANAVAVGSGICSGNGGFIPSNSVFLGTSLCDPAQSISGGTQIVIGYLLGYAINSGGNNILMGYAVANGAASGAFANNIMIGWGSGNVASGAHDNVFLGYQAGNTVTSGSNIVCIGSGAQANAATDTNEVVIGSGVTGNGSHTVTLGATTDGLYIGPVKSYNGVATAGQGVPSIYSSGNTAGAVAQIASNSSYTVGAADGTFLITANILVTTATLHSFTAEVAYTDEGNTARVLTLSYTLLAGGALGTLVTNGNGAVPYEYVPVCIRAKAATAITVRTNAGGTYTTVAFNMRSAITQIA